MNFSKLKISSDASSRLRSLRQRTGLTPNLLCRLALMQSLEDGPLGEAQAPDEAGMEFNAYTLTGEFHALFLSLVRFVEEGPTPARALTGEQLVRRLRGHIHRGVGTLSVRLKGPVEVAKLAIGA